jgi:hypothetical protein
VVRASVLLAYLTDEPTTTSDLYDRVGYRALTQMGLIPYEAFREQLAQLSDAGLAERATAPDGSTTWCKARPRQDG